MKRTLPIVSQPAARASTLPPTSDNVIKIPNDPRTFMTVLLFAGPVHESTLYSRKTAFAGQTPSAGLGARGEQEEALWFLLRVKTGDTSSACVSPCRAPWPRQP